MTAKFLANLEFLVWGIRYGWILFFSNFELWGMILGSNYGDCWPVNIKSAEEACLRAFWDDLNEGIDGWRD